MPDIEIDRRVEVRIIELLDHVRTDNAQLRSAMGDEGRDIEGAHADQAHVLARGRKAERAVALVVEPVLGHDAGTRHHRQRLVEDAALGNSEGQLACHSGAALRHWTAKGQR